MTGPAALDAAASNAPETHDRFVDAAATAALVGAPDLFVFRRVSGERFVHVGGVGRGKGWAGNVELDLETDEIARRACAQQRPLRVDVGRSQRVFGPYYARAAIITPVTHDVVVVFGHPTEPLPDIADDVIVHAAESAAGALDHVSPAKRLADELEVLHAVREMMLVDAGNLGDAMEHIVACAAASLSCELGILYHRASDRLAIVEDGWSFTSSRAEILAGARSLWDQVAMLPHCVQDATTEPLPEPLAAEGGVRAYYTLAVGSPPTALLVLAHTARTPRGFTLLCRELGLRLAESADSVLRTAALRERLQSEIDRVNRDARCDALTGVGNRLAWDEAVEAEERRLSPQRSTAVMLLDVNDLKRANDTRGHDFGDRLIRTVARIVSDSVRERDVVARIGGDELAVLLPDADEVTCAAVLARIQAALDAEPPLEGFPVSAAIGVAACPPVVTLANALVVADAAMYANKQASRRPFDV